MPSVEIRTLVAAGVAAWMMAFGILVFIWHTGRTYRGFGLWILHAALAAAGLTLLALRGPVPESVSVLGGNGLIYGSTLVLAASVRTFLDSRPSLPRWLWVSPAALVAYLAWFLFVTPSVPARISGVSLFISGAVGLAAWHLLSTPARHLGPPARLTGWGVAAFAVLMGYRGLQAAMGRAATDALAAGPEQVLTYSSGMIVGILSAFGIVMMNHRRLEMDLEGARDTLQASLDALGRSRAKVKVLEGMLPICASCKRIRDEQGAWTRIEVYIHQHSQAEFSHGICPDCSAALYPDLASPGQPA